jgi:hypothetical protein
VRPRVLLPFIEGELDSRSFAAAAQLAALHLSQDPVMYADWDVTFDLTYVQLNDTKEDGAHSLPCIQRAEMRAVPEPSMCSASRRRKASAWMGPRHRCAGRWLQHRSLRNAEALPGPGMPSPPRSKACCENAYPRASAIVVESGSNDWAWQRAAVRKLQEHLPALHLHPRECRADIAGQGASWLKFACANFNENDWSIGATQII